MGAYLLTLDAINFGSGWFPTLPSGRAVGLLHGGLGAGRSLPERRAWSAAELRPLSAADVARCSARTRATI